ncbi:sigma-70 family RNA polymerase sigma factor [Clostridium polynesiense]|uniref:sigma-70 family RNA polymerase sigma factor n=1 Tax=Clostridium polynesiense TaxID=1325933 RepID=UPI0005911AF4|nr:sigma-70 family RNA polymerase sigma factor [Clostridium polynesiense]
MNFDLEVSLAIKGNKDSFIHLIEHLESYMYKVSKSMLYSDSDCADAIQETILKAYKNIASIKNPQFFKTWLIRILINECNKINNYKKKVIPMEEIFPDSQGTGITDSLSIEHSISLLEDDLKEAVILYYFEDLPVKEISRVLNIPEGTVKSRLSRARVKLAKSLGNDFQRSDNCERRSI